MPVCEMTIIPMQEKYAREIIQWRYDGVYVFYNRKESYLEELLDGNHAACVGLNGELIGYFAFGPTAQIPTVEENVYIEDLLDIGLGIRPDLCGKGMGRAFLEKGMRFAGTSFGKKAFRLSVAAFNERAIKVYEKCGFIRQREVTNAYFQNLFYIMTVRR